MKNGLLVWNVVLTLLVGYLLIAQFAGKKKSAGGEIKNSSVKTSDNGSFRIAYFEMDSVEANFEMVKDVKAELTIKEDAINSELDRLQKNFQQRYNFFQMKAQGGTMTQADSEAATQELKNLDEQAKNRKNTLDQEYSELSLRKQKEIKNRIEEFLKEYNKTQGYAYIAAFEQGLFYYKDTAYNITNDVVKGLNLQYKVRK